jgi:large subunit ribosomal protein L31
VVFPVPRPCLEFCPRYTLRFAGFPASRPLAIALILRDLSEFRPASQPATTSPWSVPVKDKIHPEYHPECKVYFRGDVVMTVGATVPEMHVEVWSGSHPFYTGKSAFVDTAGRVEKFQRKFAGNYFDNKKKKEA